MKSMTNLLSAMVVALLFGVGAPAHAGDAKPAMTPLVVNINTADAQTLATALDGVGAARAQAIVQYRDAHGPFRSVNDLTQVKGIGERVLTANRDRITVKE